MTSVQSSNLEARARAIFIEIVEEPADRREAALIGRCGDDENLRQRVDMLLAAHDHGANFLTPPPPLFGFQLPGEGGSSAEPSSAADDPLIGQHVARYRVLRRLAAGGMGVVYLAQQDQPRRTVALKIMRAGLASRSMLRRFEHEAEVLGQLQHPGIAQIYEAGTFDLGRGAQPYFAMEFIDGRRLGYFAQAHDLSVAARLELLAQICDAVQYAHHKGVIHRDLKPDNILVLDPQRDGGTKRLREDDVSASSMPHPKILDFGVARLTDSDIAVTTLQTDVGQIVGTLPYMSPEQIAGDPRLVDTRSDVYALGVIGYELLAGKLPLDVRHKTMAEAARIITEHDPPALTHINRLFRGDLSTIIAKVLEKDKARRYQSASELADDLRRFLGHEPIRARPTTTVYAMRKFARRHTALVAGIAGVFLMLVLGVVGTSVGLVRAKESARIAKDKEGLAEVAAKEATRQRAAAEQVSGFLQQMLASVNPSMARGRDTALVREILDDAAARVETELADQPDIAATLHGVIGRTFASIAEYERAIDHLSRALETRRAIFKHQSPEIAQSTGDLGRAYLSASRHADAAPLLEEALDVSRLVHGPAHPLTARAMTDLANARRAAGQYEDAERMLRQASDALSLQPETDVTRLRTTIDLANTLMARHKFREARPLYAHVLAVRQRTLPEDSPEIAGAEASMGRVLTSLDDFDAALAHMERALAIYRRVLPPGHDTLATALLNMASLQYQRRDYDANAALLEEAMAACRATFGDEHPSAARILAAQSNLARALQHNDQAERLCLQALEMRRRTLPQSHPDIANSLRQLSGIRNSQNRPQEALGHLREALAIQRVHGPTDYDACESLLNLVMFEMRFGDITLAEKSVREVIPMFEALLGADAPETVSAGSRLAVILERQRRFEEAIPLRARVLEHKRAAREPDNEIADATVRLALTLMACGQWSEAETHLRESLRLQESFFGDEHIALARSLSPLGECLTQLARFQEAEEALIEAERLTPPRLPRSAEMREIHRRLHDLYVAWGKPEDAAKWPQEPGPAGAEPASAPSARERQDAGAGPRT